MKRLLLSLKPSDKLQGMIDALCTTAQYTPIDELETILPKAGDLLVIAADVDLMGDSPAINVCLGNYLKRGYAMLKGVQCALLINSETIYYSKSYAQRLAFTLNAHGAFFNGHGLMEAVKGFQNYATWQKVYSMPLEAVCHQRIASFNEKIDRYRPVVRKRLLALHASERSKSNTFALWEKVKHHLTLSFDIQVRHIENGQVIDCAGCDYHTCLHYAEQKSCFYGGQVTKELLPSIEWADIIVWICPNYNDAVSAMHTALINRLTVLYRRISLMNKQIYGIVVSANSGGDVVAGQLISALNFNKGFMLPPQAMLCATANDPGSIHSLDNIDSRAEAFAMRIVDQADM